MKQLISTYFPSSNNRRDAIVTHIVSYRPSWWNHDTNVGVWCVLDHRPEMKATCKNSFALMWFWKVLSPIIYHPVNCIQFKVHLLRPQTFDLMYLLSKSEILNLIFTAQTDLDKFEYMCRSKDRLPFSPTPLQILRKTRYQKGAAKNRKEKQNSPKITEKHTKILEEIHWTQVTCKLHNFSCLHPTSFAVNKIIRIFRLKSLSH